MQVRAMTMEDYDKVYELWACTPGVGLSAADDARAGIERFLRRNPRSCFVAQEGGRLTGTILSGHDGRCRAGQTSGRRHPDFRRRGVGRALVHAAMDALEAEGIAKTMLVVFKANAGGNEFWESLGFTVRDDLVYRNKALDT